jgi:hypothetical protein
MKRLLALLVLIAPLPLGCGQVSTSTSSDGSGQGGSAAGTTGSAGTTGGAGRGGSLGNAGTTGSAGRGGATGSAGTTGAAGSGGTTGSGGSAAGAGGAGGGCTFGGMTYPVGASFPAGDGCNTCSCTAGGQVACTLRACPPDAGAPVCAFDTTYRYGDGGGHVIYEDRTTLTPPSSYQRTRNPVQTDPPSYACSPALPACNSAAIDVSDVMRDLADADVQKALAMATPPIYGRDQRPVDGNIFSFLRNDGRGFLAGSPCNGAAACVEIPPGVANLLQTLRALDDQQLKDASCAALR